MKSKLLTVGCYLLVLIPGIGYTVSEKQLNQEVKRLQQQMHVLQQQLTALQQHSDKTKKSPQLQHVHSKTTARQYHVSKIIVHTPAKNTESSSFYPTAFIADNQIVTYIAGTPVVSSPFLGARPAFDGSDYIVNISSINRDLRLMEQRRMLYRAYKQEGYPPPNRPIIALSGKSQPLAMINQPPFEPTTLDLNLGANELDVAAVLNDKVEAFMGIVYDAAPPSVGGQRVANSAFGLSLGFINIGNLDDTPFYFTAGQLYAPFGRYSSSMVSAPLPLMLGRTLTRPFILGYKSQENSGPYVAIYAFKSDTTLNSSGIGGVNIGYLVQTAKVFGDFGAGLIANIADSNQMQFNGANSGNSSNVFGGFASAANGNEEISQIPGVDAHANISMDRYNFAAEWVCATRPFRARDLSFNGSGAQPQAGQLEGSVTFKIFDKPASVGLGYQWTKQALALQLPQQRATGVFNISMWKDTVESIEYRHDINFNANQYANGAAPTGSENNNTIGTNQPSDTITLQIGVYF